MDFFKKIKSDDLLQYAEERVNSLTEQAKSVTEIAQCLRHSLVQQIHLDRQLERQLKERLKELSCLYAIRLDMDLDLSVDEFLQRLFKHLITAMQFPEIAVAMVEFEGNPFVSDNYSQALRHELHAPIMIGHKMCGQLRLFYTEDKPFLLPEEQNLIEAIATDLQRWFEHRKMINDLQSSLKEVKMIQFALDAHAIVATTDRQGRITYVNDKFCDISKYSREELLGQDHRIINAHFHPKEFMRNLWETIAKGGVWRGEIRNRARDGAFYWVDTTIVPFLNAARKPYQYIAIRTEITQRKEMARLMEMQIMELARSNSELAQFTYVATHDLQEPLRSVSSCVLLLKKRYEKQLDARADEFISHAVSGVERMQALINDLSVYSRVDASRSAIPTDCSKLLDNVLANLTFGIAESGAVITHESLPTVNGNPNQLAQVFQNLISNAIKFCGEHPPKIHIGAVRKDGEWLFSVADQGIGIEALYFERIFRIFQRLHTRKDYPGTGIGLAICKKAVEYHDGRIWVESSPGKGATFYFSIPD